MFVIYLIGAALIILCSFYYAGQWEQPKERPSFFEDQEDIIKCGLAVGVFWPLVLGFVIVASPAALFFYLGERKRKKINAAKAVDSNS